MRKTFLKGICFSNRLLILLFVALILFYISPSIVSSASNPLKSLFEKAMSAFVKGDYSTAMDLFEKTLDIYPLAAAYNYLGLCHKATGTDLKDVIWFFKKAIELDPNYVNAYDNLGRIYYELGNFEKAEEYCKKALEIDKDCLSAKLALGWIDLLGLSKPEEAIYYFEQAKKKVDIPYLYLGLGVAYYMNNQNPEALEMITALRQHNREDLALELEKIIRQNKPIGRVRPVQVLDTSDRKNLLRYGSGAMSTNSNTYPLPAVPSGMKVRLRQIPREEDDIPLAKKQPLTGSDRIRALQKRFGNIDDLPSSF